METENLIDLFGLREIIQDHLTDTVHDQHRVPFELMDHDTYGPKLFKKLAKQLADEIIELEL